MPVGRSALVQPDRFRRARQPEPQPNQAILYDFRPFGPYDLSMPKRPPSGALMAFVLGSTLANDGALSPPRVQAPRGWRQGSLERGNIFEGKRGNTQSAGSRRNVQ
ncbi:MAG: hypothetical protein C4583_03040 [Anaerolineaceae bacterium]|nr:MAG: hypothetical protein C4583_03040 [Anaerolineaceae bacterium]